MGVNFNGEVTINGNVEIYTDGSMKIIDNRVEVTVNDLPEFIKSKALGSPNFKNYLDAAEGLKSHDPDTIKDAWERIRKLAREVGINILVTGLSHAAISAINLPKVT